MVIQPPNDSKGKVVRLGFRVGPKNIMTQLMIDRVDPLALGFVFSPSLPIFRVDQINLAIFIGLARGLAPVDVLIPFDLG